MTSVSNLCSLNRALAVTGCGGGGAEEPPVGGSKAEAALALLSSGLNRAGGNRPEQVGLSGVAPSSSERSASLISPSSDVGDGLRCGSNGERWSNPLWETRVAGRVP